jgi:hypothetical protein
MPKTGPDAVPVGGTADSLPGWRRPVLVISHLGDRCRTLGEVLSRVVGTGAEPAILCLAPHPCPSAGSDAPETHPCPSQAQGHPARTVQFRRVDLTDGRRGHPPDDPGGRRLTSAVEETVRSHAGDGVLTLNLSPAADHPLHHRAAQAALQAAGSLGVHALVQPFRSRPARPRPPVRRARPRTSP